MSDSIDCPDKERIRSALKRVKAQKKLGVLSEVSGVSVPTINRFIGGEDIGYEQYMVLRMLA